MEIRWFGQSAFLLRGEQSVVVDPFADVSVLATRGLQFDYPPIVGVRADVLLVTHEHVDHSGVDAVEGEPLVIRSTAGTFETPIGEVVAIAGEHDDVAGTTRGPNTLFRFALDGLRVCHLGDLGQSGLRPEQRAAIGEVDVLFVPVGDGPTIGGGAAADLVRELGPRLVVPMHFRTPAVNFLEPPDAFLEAMAARVETLDASEVRAADLLGSAADPTVVLFAVPS